METIETLRSNLDALDARLVNLVADRFDICLQIAQCKLANGIPMMQPGRIEKVKRHAAALGVPRGLSEEFLARFYDLIIEEACQVELRRMNQGDAHSANNLERDSSVPFKAVELSPAVVIGAKGAVGRLFASKLQAEGIHVTGIDRVLPASSDLVTGDFLATDILSPDESALQAIASAKTVIVCLLESTALAAFPIIRKHMRSQSLWVDTLSIKSAICKLLAEDASGLEMISLNPMFAPACGFSGQNVVAVEVAAGPRSANLLAMLRSWNANVTTLSAEEHDLVTAGIQVATHAAAISFGSALQGLRINLARALQMTTPPFLLLTAVLVRILSGNPEVYWDIQTANPQGGRARNELCAGLSRLQEAIARNDLQQFRLQLTGIREHLGDNIERFQKQCNALFSKVQPGKHHS